MKLSQIYSAIYWDDCHPFKQLCDNVSNVKTPDEMTDRDAALVIWGGADIHPNYYKRPMHRTTHPGGQRDKMEWSLLQKAIELGIPIFGVCRGAQMLCAAAGGWLIQDVHGHVGHGGHEVTTITGEKFRVNSIHHQMMCGLENTEHELVGWSSTRLSEKLSPRRSIVADHVQPVAPYGIDDDQSWTPPEGWVEPEFVYFSKINGYAIQWHPEGMDGGADATKYILSYIEKKESARGGKIASFPICVC